MAEHKKVKMAGVETDEFRKARARHLKDSHVAGVRATLEKGREMDAEHERKPEPEVVKSIAEREREEIEEAKEAIREGERVKEIFAIAEKEIDEVVTEAHKEELPSEGDGQAEEAKTDSSSSPIPGEAELIAETIEDAVAQAVEVLTPENETVSELEQLKVRLAELEEKVEK